MTDGREQFEVLQKAENLDRVNILLRLLGREVYATHQIVHEHEQTYLEPEILFTGSATANNNVKTQCDHFRLTSAVLQYGTLVLEPVQHPPAASHRIFLNQRGAKALFQQFCREI